MAELDAYGRAVNGFTLTAAWASDGSSAVVNLAGAPKPNQALHPALHLARGDISALLASCPRVVQLEGELAALRGQPPEDSEPPVIS